MGGEEGQLLHALLPQVQQQGGVDHGDGEAAQAAPLPGGEVLRRPAVVSLQEESLSTQERAAASLPAFQKAELLHLGGDSAPEVGVGALGVQHGGDHRLVLGDQQVEGVGVGQDVVRVGVLKGRKEGKVRTPAEPEPWL